jgi:opacity protein-like surface antigen
MKKRFALALSIALLVAAVLVPAVAAGGWGGSFGLGSLWFDGYFAGLGNNNAEVTLTATGTIYALCQNNGGNIAPGRSPVNIEVTATGTWLTDENGRADGMVEAFEPTIDSIPVSPSPKSLGCPSDSWTVVGFNTNTTNWTSANLYVTALDNPSQVFFDLDFTCVTSFDENGVHTGVECTLAP